MTDADLITTLRTRLAYHETEAERCRRMLAIAEDDGPARTTKKPAKAKGSGEQRRPPSRAGTRDRVAAWLKEHPTGTAAECGKALGMKPNSVGYHLTALRPRRRPSA